MSEDQEWSRHWVERGHAIVYDPEAAVYHSHTYTLGGLFRRFYNSGATSAASYLPASAGANLRFALNGLSFLGREVGFLVRKGHDRWLPYAAIYEAFRVAGLVTGRLHRLLPAAVHRRLSYRI